MPDSPRRFQIRIDSVLGGHSRTTHFSGSGQYRASVAIDPGSPIQGSASSPYSNSIYGIKPSGLIRPTKSNPVSGTMNRTPLWMRGARSTTSIFVMDARGSVYTYEQGGSMTALNDVGATAGGGNGMEYYDNYMYFATNTDIARFGPLSGDPVFTENFWTAAPPNGLGKTALENASYPYISLPAGTSTKMPTNHFLHRHSDGRLYIADTVSNQGYIHYIKTSRTTVEGDTFAAADSVYQALALGYGLVPICMESLGSNLVIACYERDTSASLTKYGIRGRTTRAKIAFWDTLSTNFNSITWVEFPDGLITAMKNVNGTLYVFSAPSEKSNGFRVSRYVGGYTFEEIWSSEEGTAPLPGAVDGTSSRLVFGSFTLIPKSTGCIYSLGLSANGISNGIFCPFSSNIADNTFVTTLMLPSYSGRGKGWDYPVWGSGDFSSTFRLEDPGNGSSADMNAVFWSQVYRIGQRFKITKIRIPLGEALTASSQITPKIYTDDGFGTAFTLTAITSANFGTTQRTIIIHPENVTGESNFWLELSWGSTYQHVVGLPITIEYEIIPDD